MEVPKKSQIVTQFKKKEFDEIKDVMLFTAPLLEHSVADMKILKTWENHFRSVGSPFITGRYVISYGGRKDTQALGIWKERRVR